MARKKQTKRTNMQIIDNEGQWHRDIDRVHTYSNGDWVIVFQTKKGYSGYLDNYQASVISGTPVKVIPSKEDALKFGLAAFTMTGEKANLVMRNELGV